jgi:CelD/BcsL family acetyltransferase involved in cellulose biosynthesis
LPVQSWSFFTQLQRQLLQKGFGFIVTAYKDDKCVGGTVFLQHNHTLIEKYSATNEVGRHSLAMDLVLWQAICWGCENGYTSLDMGRSDIDQAGLREFKARWGAQETPLEYSYFPAHQQSLRQSRLTAVVQSAFRHAPLWVVRLSGELLYQYLA